MLGNRRRCLDALVLVTAAVSSLAFLPCSHQAVSDAELSSSGSAKISEEPEVDSAETALTVTASLDERDGDGTEIPPCGDGTCSRDETPETCPEDCGAPPSAVAAFPGAEGFGAASTGGRGGVVIEVTNLSDSGPGSLRAAIDATGPRTVVFRVGGTIELMSGLEFMNPFITVAGQTAPGDGIQLSNHPSNTETVVRIKTHDVVLRYLRLRPGPSLEPEDSLDPLTISRDAHDVIVDHCSLSWGTDEGLQTWDTAHDITIQWSIISEALHCSTHPKGCHSTGMLIGDQSNRITLHHNLLAHNSFRNPRVRGGDMDLVNNVIYNAGTVAARLDDQGNLAGMRCNFVGNYFKRGPSSSWSWELKIRSEGKGTSCYVSGNIGPHRPDNTYPEENIVDPDDRGLMTDTRFPFPSVTTTSASRAYDRVLAGAGADKPRRDSVDQRIVHDVRTGTGRIIDDPQDVGGRPEFQGGEPPIDDDHDGMADSWEMLHGLDPTDPSDRNGDLDNDDYTNLEEYLNGTAP